MKSSPRTRILVLVIGYLAVTIAGLFLFRGIPVLNVGLGFPLGAMVALRRMTRDAPLREVARVARPRVSRATGERAG